MRTPRAIRSVCAGVDGSAAGYRPLARRDGVCPAPGGRASALPDDWTSPRPTVHRTAVNSPMTYDAMWRETVNARQRRVRRLDWLTW
jgi:hypothetical protein